MANPANTGVAPICNAPAVQPNFATTPPSIPRFVPPTADFQSLVFSIMQIQQALTVLFNPPPHNNMQPGLPAGGGGAGGTAGLGGGGKKSPQTDPDQWQETGRVTQNVKVVNPDDNSQFVIVKEIVSVTFSRPSSGETITFKRDSR